MDPQQDQSLQPQQPAVTSPAPVVSQMPAAPSAQTAQMSEDPGKTLGIVGLVLAFVAPLIGLILSIIARNKSKKAGHNNSLALIGIIVGAVLTVIGIIIAVIVTIAAVSLVSKCSELGPGTHYVNGATYTCGTE